MNKAAWLIAEREFKTYVATLSFWLALVIGPLIALGALAISVGTALPASVSVQADGAALARALSDAVVRAGRSDGHTIRIVHFATRDSVAAVGKGHRLVLKFSDGFPLSASGRALAGSMLERELFRQQFAVTRYALPSVEIVGAPAGDSGAWSRFMLTAFLWLTLTGSLGMLLQAVVRERANRALEALLAAATPLEIMAGKLLGVGAVSVLVLLAWLGSAGAASLVAPRVAGAVPTIFSGLNDWTAFARAAIIYLAAYAFYGAVTFGVGAAARDTAAAQNLSRPMFAVLLVAFFTSMAGASGVHLDWLVYVPPFTPFVLLTGAPDGFSRGTEIAALVLFAVATLAAFRLAAGQLRISGVPATR